MFANRKERKKERRKEKTDYVNQESQKILQDDG